MAGTPALTPRLSVIVVAHDSGDDLLHCVRSILAASAKLAAATGRGQGPLPHQQASGPPDPVGAALVRDERSPVELILVDNASADASLAALPAVPELRLLLNPDNRGFARACNQGAELARAETLLFLNPDCVLPADALAQLLPVLDANPEIGILGAQLLNDDGSEQAASARDDPSPVRAVRTAVGLRAPVTAPNAVLPAAAKDQRHATPVVRVDAVSGALMLMRRATFLQLGGFDEGYVFHCEDLDLCRRARLAGHAVAITPQVRVLHRKGTSSRARPIWVEWHKHRGMWRYFRKFDADATAMPVRGLLLLGLCGHFVVAAAGRLLSRR